MVCVCACVCVIMHYNTTQKWVSEEPEKSYKLLQTLQIPMQKPNPQNNGIWRRGLRVVIRVMRVEPHSGDSGLYKETPGSILSVFCLLKLQGRQRTRNHGAGSHQTPNLLGPWSWPSHLQNCEKWMLAV